MRSARARSFCTQGMYKVYPEAVLPEEVWGLPLHPLVIHAVVVLVPLTAVGALLMALRPRFSKRFGVIVVIGAFLSAVSAFLAKESGENLAGTRPVSGEHVMAGDVVPLPVLGFAVLLTVFWLFDRGVPGNRSRPVWLKALAVAVVIAAIACTYLVIRAGHTGALSVWG